MSRRRADDAREGTLQHLVQQPQHSGRHISESLGMGGASLGVALTGRVLPRLFVATPRALHEPTASVLPEMPELTCSSPEVEPALAYTRIPALMSAWDE